MDISSHLWQVFLHTFTTKVKNIINVFRTCKSIKSIITNIIELTSIYFQRIQFLKTFSTLYKVWTTVLRLRLIASMPQKRSKHTLSILFEVSRILSQTLTNWCSWNFNESRLWKYCPYFAKFGSVLQRQLIHVYTVKVIEKYVVHIFQSMNNIIRNINGSMSIYFQQILVVKTLFIIFERWTISCTFD